MKRNTTQLQTRPLEDLLGGLSKEGLNRIRRALQVKGASSLNKNDLIARLQTAMVASLPSLIGKLDRTRYDALRMLAGQGGMQKMLQASEALAGSLQYYEDRGLVFLEHAEDIWMPREVYEFLQSARADKELEARITLNTEWTKLTAGMLFYYGTMPPEQLIDKIAYYTGQDVPPREFAAVMQEFEAYDSTVVAHSVGYVYYLVNKPETLVYEHGVRASVDYYPFTKAQILRAAEEDFVDRNDGYRQLVNVLCSHWEIDKDSADFLVEELVYSLQNGTSPTGLVSELQDQLDFADMNQVSLVVDKLMNMANHTRQWALKGYFPLELMASGGELQPLPAQPFPIQPVQQPIGSSATVYSFQTKQKIGRNDPCPCGSGVKYKKCCGAPR